MMKTVNFIIASLSTGGAEKVVANLSKELVNRYNVNIILFGSNSSEDYSTNGNIIYLDKINTRLNPIYKIFAFFLRINKLRKIKKKSDISISFIEYPNFINVLSRVKGHKTVLSVRNHMTMKHSKGLKSMIWKWTIRRYYRNADKIVSCSKEIEYDLIKNYHIPSPLITVIYNGYPINEIRKMSTETLDVKEQEIFDKPVIISIGRLSYHKGFTKLIKAFHLLKKDYNDFQLVILGKGEMLDELNTLITDLHLNDSVHILGFKKNPYTYIAKSKVFVLNSSYEGFPNVLLEAMICGLPVISSDCLSGPREIIAPSKLNEITLDYSIDLNRFGVLFPGNRNENQSQNAFTIMTKHIQELMYNENLRTHFSKKSIERSNEFDLNSNVLLWELLLNSLLK